MIVEKDARIYEEMDPMDTVDDALLQRSVRGELDAEEFLDAAQITCSVTDNVVLLSGEASSEIQRNRAEAVASEVANVFGVENDIRLKT